MADLDSIVKDTISTLGKIIKKPPLSEKHLKKPPFRFLHDIVFEVSLCKVAAPGLSNLSLRQISRTSGFLEGLFQGDERVSNGWNDQRVQPTIVQQDSKKIAEKEAKMAFLQKAIDATCKAPSTFCSTLHLMLSTAFTIGKSLSAQPRKIVAGHDPENTNIWLQAMAYAVKKKVGPLCSPSVCPLNCA